MVWRYVYHYEAPRVHSLTTTPASEADLRRERMAKNTFARVSTEFLLTAPTTLAAGSCTVLPLLDPPCHLTSYTWTTFREWVQTHEGWDVKRRVATEREKKESGMKCKGKVYFVMAIYSAPKPNSKKKKLEDQRKLPAAKKPKLGDVTNQS